MQIGIDSFAAAISDPVTGLSISAVERMQHLLEEMELADRVGLDVFGIGEHHRAEFLDSAPAVILAAAAARTKNIRLTSAVTVLSAADPVRVFQEFATLDLISHGRAEIVAGRGSFVESYPLFGLRLEDYDELFTEKLDLLLAIRENTHVKWSGKHRAPLTGQSVYPRPLQDPLPIWVGVGGTPTSFVRAGMLGLPLMVAIIGGEPKRFRPLVDAYREAGRGAGHPCAQFTGEVTRGSCLHRLSGRHHPASRRRLLSRVRAHLHRDRQGTRLAADHPGAVRRRPRAHRRVAHRRRRHCCRKNTVWPHSP